MSLNLKDLQDAEQFQKHFVTPLVDAVRAEVRPIVEQSKTHEQRLDQIENNQRKALGGIAVYATLASVVIGGSIDWFKRKLGW